MQEGVREKLARERAAAAGASHGDEGKPLLDSPNDASSEDSNDSNRYQKGAFLSHYTYSEVEEGRVLYVNFIIIKRT